MSVISEVIMSAGHGSLVFRADSTQNVAALSVFAVGPTGTLEHLGRISMTLETYRETFAPIMRNVHLGTDGEVFFEEGR